jgi:hypothetical protein
VLEGPSANAQVTLWVTVAMHRLAFGPSPLLRSNRQIRTPPLTSLRAESYRIGWVGISARSVTVREKGRDAPRAHSLIDNGPWSPPSVHDQRKNAD